MAWRDPDDLNVKKERGAPPNRMASPMTTSEQPNFTATLGDIIGIPDPPDPLGNNGPVGMGGHGKRESKK